jgi:hypothetical protein
MTALSRLSTYPGAPPALPHTHTAGVDGIGGIGGIAGVGGGGTSLPPELSDETATAVTTRGWRVNRGTAARPAAVSRSRPAVPGVT